MRKPTREEVDGRLANVRLEVMGIGEVLLSPSTRKPMVNAVMALFEDKPKPKWEEEFDRFYRMDNKCDDPDMYKDFIREKLREVCDDALACVNNADDEEVRKKWGL